MVGSTGGNDDRNSWARQLATLGHVGTMFPVAIGLGFLGGWYLDGWLGTRPWLALAGFGLGVAAGLRNLIRSAARFGAEEDRAARDREARNRWVPPGRRQPREPDDEPAPKEPRRDA